MERTLELAKEWDMERTLELAKEWDMERTLEFNAAIAASTGELNRPHDSVPLITE
jgi:hypothetical protein